MRFALVFGLVTVLTGALAGCTTGMPDDVVKQQDLSRMHQHSPTAAELPPGLSEDLPMPPPATTMIGER